MSRLAFTATIFGELVRPNGITGKSIPNSALGQGYKLKVRAQLAISPEDDQLGPKHSGAKQ